MNRSAFFHTAHTWLTALDRGVSDSMPDTYRGEFAAPPMGPPVNINRQYDLKT